MQLGAASAMQLGLAESALSFYQTVLKFDPEQDRARVQYRGLKKVIKLMDKAESEVGLGGVSDIEGRGLHRICFGLN